MVKPVAKIRTLGQLHERRKEVVRLYAKGLLMIQIVQSTGLCHRAVQRAIKQYEQGGDKNLVPARRGRREGDGRSLTDEQAKSIQETIHHQQPESLMMEYKLWNRIAVMQLIEQQYDITLSLPSVSDYLKRWHFNTAIPLKKAAAKHPEIMQQWLENEYSRIVKQARTKNAEIHWCNQTVITHDAASGESISEKRTMISSITNLEQTRWRVFSGTLNTDKFTTFLAALIQDVDRKVLLILNNSGIHHSKMVKDWVANRPDQIELFYLPLLT